MVQKVRPVPPVSASGSTAAAIAANTSRARPARRGRGRRGSHHWIEGRSAPNAGRRVRRKIGYARRSQFCSELAEGAGFEPAIRFPVYTLSRRAPSTARPPLRRALHGTARARAIAPAAARAQAILQVRNAGSRPIAAAFSIVTSKYGGASAIRFALPPGRASSPASAAATLSPRRDWRRRWRAPATPPVRSLLRPAEMPDEACWRAGEG